MARRLLAVFALGEEAARRQSAEPRH